ncbi:MAG: molybdopterin-dependent oxidoreductase [Desulfobacterales bacterium]|jgi:anaerobic selenocysteine-containing dehydrogenase
MEKKTYRSICQFCHSNCGIIVHRSANGTTDVEGDPEHPMNRGRCCPKVAAIPEVIGSKDRLKVPLRKTSKGFEEISWEKALDFAADRLGEIRDRFGPLSLVRCGGAPVSYQCRDGFLEFMGAFGSPNFTGAANLCMVPRMTAFMAVTGGIRAEPDYDNTRLVLFWGSDPLTSERYGSYAAYNGMQQIIPRLKKRGTRMISIDPFRSRTAAQADEWVRIRPGGDVALGLAMIHVIIEESLYDKTFVEAYTSGFDALAAHVQACDPAWAEALTGIPAKTIEDLARTYATTKPATIYEGNGLDMIVNGVDAVRTVAILIGLTGNLDVPGGNVFMPFAQQSSLPTKAVPTEKRVGYDQFPLFREVPFPAIKSSLLAEEQSRPRAMVVHHSNPALVQANEKRTRQALQKVNFLMVNDIFPTATAALADLVLPITSDFESYGYRAYSSLEGGFLALARPVAPPVGMSRPVFEVEYELAERMGLQKDYPFQDTISWLKHMIRPSGVSFERLDEEQIVYATPAVQYRKFEQRGFSTPSGKVEFYSTVFESKGYSPLPVFSEPAGEALEENLRSSKEFPLLGSTKRPAHFVHTKFRNIKALTRSYPDPLVWLHPQDALERSIPEGSEVEVSSPRGQITLKAKLTEDTQPGHIWIDFGWGNPTDGKANINVLVDDTHFDPVSGGTPHRLFECEVRKLSR